MLTTRKIILTTLTLCLCALAYGQHFHVDEVSIDTRATFHQETINGVYNSGFKGDYLNLHILGQITDKLSFRIRHRLNVLPTKENPFKATDFLWLKWQFAPQWSLTAGKQPILIGGYEIDSPPIEVYYYGAFSARLDRYYDFGASVTFSPAPGQAISLQFCPSPVSTAMQSAYSYNLYWNGHIGRYWKTIWSYNLVEDGMKRKMNWFVLGNKFLLGKLVVDVDLIDRVAFGHSNFFSDWSVIGKAILSLGKWNLCTKVGYERNSAANVDANGVSLDLVLPAGEKFFYGGAGVEFFPLGNEKLRLHAVYFRDNHDHMNNFDIGVTWRFDIYRRK